MIFHLCTHQLLVIGLCLLAQVCYLALSIYKNFVYTKIIMRVGFYKIVLLFLISFSLFAEKTPVKNLYQYTLDNGLSLFVAENHSVPLSYIEIAVKCGAFTQEKETAGLFHLYEHLMFKGNSLFPNAASVTRALSLMGVSEWNGSTGLECVNYYFTVPSDETERGLAFWNAAIRTPLIKKKELENEKKVVLSEINGNFTDPARILTAARCSSIFGDFPWKTDPSGSPEVVINATKKQLLEIKKKYYVPNNSAVFVGGDVNPDDVYEMVKRIFGSWKQGENPFEGNLFQHNTNPFSAPKKCVMPYERISSDFARIEVVFRGPDTLFDVESTYPADVLSETFSNPTGFFATTLTNDAYLAIPNADYVWGGYPTSFVSGMLNFGAMVQTPQVDLPSRAVYFAEKIPELVKGSANISKEQIKDIARKINDLNIYSAETAEGLLQTVRFWWITTGVDYYFSYSEKMSEVTPEDLEEFTEKYIADAFPLITVLVNPHIYEIEKDEFERNGFQEISSDNAFWWKHTFE